MKIAARRKELETGWVRRPTRVSLAVVVVVAVAVAMVAAMALMVAQPEEWNSKSSGGVRAAHHGLALFCQKEIMVLIMLFC